MKTVASKCLSLLSLIVALICPTVEARVTRIVIISREIVADGISFGDTGPYEKLRGTVFFEVDPDDPRNAVVFDLEKAPRNDQGMVEFSADMMIIKPVDLDSGNHELFFEVNNRGSAFIPVRLNSVTPGASGDHCVAGPFCNDPTTVHDFGNGYMQRQGYTLAWVGWQADVMPGDNRLTVQFPTAVDHGKPITQSILAEFADARGAASTAVFTLPLSNDSTLRSYEAVSTDPEVAMAELRMRPSDSPRPPTPALPEGKVIPTSQWSFARCPDGPPGSPSTTNICQAGGFQNDMVYQLIYKAMSPPVMGLGYVTTRDFVSFLRSAETDDAGTPNPVPGITTVLGLGESQSGRYLRDFLYQGFNEDEHGQRVFDGVNVLVAGVKSLFLNYRFAQPSAFSNQHSGRYGPYANFPIAYAVRKNPLPPYNTDGILKRPRTDPKVIQVDSSMESWQSSSSLNDTDEDGMVDLDPPENVRLYLLSSTQHGARQGALPSHGTGDLQSQQLSNPIHPGALNRALIAALDEWVNDGTTPPDSRVPRIGDGTLVPSDQESTGFPNIPAGPTWSAVTYNGLFNASGELYFGPRVSGNRGVIDQVIPEVLSVHRVLVPKVDEIGNDIAGVRHPFVEAPKATLTGWNLRTPEFTDGDLMGPPFGMMVPLHRTREERIAAGDPRPSLEELYRNHRGYVRKVARAARRLARQRLLLQEDVDRIIQEAEDSDVLR